VSGSLLLRIYSVTAYGTTAFSSISSTALARLTLRQRCAAQYVVTACVCEKRRGNCSCHRGRYPLRRCTWGSASAEPPQTRPCRSRTERALRTNRPKRKRVASSLRLELLGWTSDAFCSSFDAVGDLSDTTCRCGKSERRDGRSRGSYRRAAKASHTRQTERAKR
jgi:hypothetical protein